LRMVPLFMFHGHRRGLATYLQAASMSPTSPFPSSRIVEAPGGHAAIVGRATSGPFTLVLRKSSRTAATVSFGASWGKLWPAACDRSGIGALQQKKGCALCEGTIVKKD
jgi:hypothetical protein